MMKPLKICIEILWSIIGGLIFSMLPKFFASGGPDRSFSVYAWWQGMDGFGRYSNDLLDEFMFGFCVTLIIIWSIKIYRKIS